jgi:hypothetical protein
MAFSIFERKTLTDTLRFPPPEPATNVKATLLKAIIKAPKTAFPIPQLAARRRSKELPPLDIETFTTASSLAQPSVRFREQFSLRSCPTAKAIAHIAPTDAIQAMANHDFYRDDAIIPGAIQPCRRSAARQSKSLPVPIKRTASVTDAVQLPPPTIDRRPLPRVPSLPAPRNRQRTPAAHKFQQQRSSTEHLRKKPFWN